MTITAVINGQSFGTSTNVGPNQFAISPTTLQTSTTAFVVNVKIVLGAGTIFSKTTKLRVWYTSIFESTTAANAPAQLGQTARYVDVILDRDTAKVDSTLEPVTGGFFNCWVDSPTLNVAGTLTVNLIELP